MPHAFGKRARTRDLFAKPFRRRGHDPVSRYMTIFKVGDIVDLLVDGQFHKGMPHKFYHGKTGRVFNINKRSLGVIINKKIGNRLIPKKLHVKIQHLRKSRCREAFVERCKENDRLKAEAKREGKTISTKRTPKQPRPEHFIDTAKTEVKMVHPNLFVDVY
jgi:large subunit ribosomal protein L21e